MKNTFFFGNGLNYLSDNPISWDDLLRKLMGDEVFEMNSLPYLLTYERIRLNWNRSKTKKISGVSHLKAEISNLLQSQKFNKYYLSLLELPFENFITTNYDYCLQSAFQSKFGIDSVEHSSTEDLYSIRRHYVLRNSMNGNVKIWNIHGELNQPKSIMLGINHYCGSIGKIDGYLKGTYHFMLNGKTPEVTSIEQKLKLNRFDQYSWLELFFNSNVHMAGFGLDFSEIDIWWVLNKRARLIEDSIVTNKIYYYTKPMSEVRNNHEVEGRKRELLKSFNVELVEISQSKGGYETFWDQLIKHLGESISVKESAVSSDY